MPIPEIPITRRPAPRLPAAAREGAARSPAAPATYVVIGGGCFGSFYVRQLLRYADRAGGPVARVVVVDRDPGCRVAREVRDPRVELAVADWGDHLAAVLAPAIDMVAAGGTVADRIVPSPFASHFVLEALRRTAAPGSRAATPAEAEPVLGGIATPFVRGLASGGYALSFATWVCPVNCIEPPGCPVLRQPLDWDMAAAVANYLLARSADVRSFHIVQCLHEAYGVGTIPLAHVAREGVRLRRAAARGGAPYAVVATVSTCHGLAGLLALD
jgi:hypothetical protein